LIKELLPFTDQIETVGSIRRRRQEVKTIDILLVPKGALLFELMAKIVSLGSEDGMKVAYKKMVILKDEFGDIEAHLWFTTTEKWPVMLLLKTGGTKSNQRIATLLKDKKCEIVPKEGSIIDENGKRLPIEKEKDIFELLGIPFLEPGLRE